MGSPAPCRFFAQGACRYGDGCRFSHASSSSGGSSSGDVDALTAALSRTTISRPPSRSAAAAVKQGSAVTKLYVDALNYADVFFLSAGRRWDLREPTQNVGKFVAAARSAGIELKVFIDEASPSDEALGKWTTRRQKEVRNGEKRLPHGWSALLGDIFVSFGVPVIYSLEADGDDTLASYAHHEGADVLSADRDFHRYRGSMFAVFHEFDVAAFRKGRLVLRQRTAEHLRNNGAHGIVKRDIITPPPVVLPPTETNPSIYQMSQTKLYRRGTPSPLTRALGYNPHQKVRHLRRALYHQLFSSSAGGASAESSTASTGSDSCGSGTSTSSAPSLSPAVPPAPAEPSVREVFPVWSAAQATVVWVDEQVAPFDPVSEAEELRANLALLSGPIDAAYKAAFPAEVSNRKPASVSKSDWDRHCFSCRAVVAELCAAATKRRLLSVLTANTAAAAANSQ